MYKYGIISLIKNAEHRLVEIELSYHHLKSKLLSKFNWSSEIIDLEPGIEVEQKCQFNPITYLEFVNGYREQRAQSYLERCMRIVDTKYDFVFDEDYLSLVKLHLATVKYKPLSMLPINGGIDAYINDLIKQDSLHWLHSPPLHQNVSPLFAAFNMIFLAQYLTNLSPIEPLWLVKR